MAHACVNYAVAITNWLCVAGDLLEALNLWYKDSGNSDIITDLQNVIQEKLQPLNSEKNFIQMQAVMKTEAPMIKRFEQKRPTATYATTLAKSFITTWNATMQNGLDILIRCDSAQCPVHHEAPAETQAVETPTVVKTLSMFGSRCILCENNGFYVFCTGCSWRNKSKNLSDFECACNDPKQWKAILCPECKPGDSREIDFGYEDVRLRRIAASWVCYFSFAFKEFYKSRLNLNQPVVLLPDYCEVPLGFLGFLYRAAGKPFPLGDKAWYVRCPHSQPLEDYLCSTCKPLCETFPPFRATSFATNVAHVCGQSDAVLDGYGSDNYHSD